MGRFFYFKDKKAINKAVGQRNAELNIAHAVYESDVMYLINTFYEGDDGVVRQNSTARSILYKATAKGKTVYATDMYGNWGVYNPVDKTWVSVPTPHISAKPLVYSSGVKTNVPLNELLSTNTNYVPMDVNTVQEGATNSGELVSSVEQATKVLQGDTVHTIKEDSLGMPEKGGFKEVVTWASELFDSFGNVAIHPVLGSVELNTQSVRDSLAHGRMSYHKNLAFAAVKDVLEKGVIVAKDSNKSEDSFYVSAPIMLKGERVIETVLVHRDVNTQRMYLHSIQLEKNLLTPRVSEAPSKDGKRNSSSVSKGNPSDKHQGMLTSVDIHNILYNILTYKGNGQQEQSKSLNIWYGSGENAHLSNLALRPFTTKDGKKYQSVEHFYQSNKTGKFDEVIYSNARWSVAGTKIARGKPKTEGDYNIKLMKYGIELSFQQNPDAMKMLLATGSTPFTHTQDSGVWKELFPQLLMEVRHDLATTNESIKGTDLKEGQGKYDEDVSKSSKGDSTSSQGTPYINSTSNINNGAHSNHESNSQSSLENQVTQRTKGFKDLEVEQQEQSNTNYLFEQIVGEFHVRLNHTQRTNATKISSAGVSQTASKQQATQRTNIDESNQSSKLNQANPSADETSDGSVGAIRQRTKGFKDLEVEQQEQPTKVILPYKNQYTQKDQAKSDKANKFIGYGCTGIEDKFNEQHQQSTNTTQQQVSNAGDLQASASADTAEVQTTPQPNTTGSNNQGNQSDGETSVGGGQTAQSESIRRTKGFKDLEIEQQEQSKSGKSFTINDIKKAVAAREKTQAVGALFDAYMGVAEKHYPDLSLTFTTGVDYMAKYHNNQITINKEVWDNPDIIPNKFNGLYHSHKC